MAHRKGLLGAPPAGGRGRHLGWPGEEYEGTTDTNSNRRGAINPYGFNIHNYSGTRGVPAGMTPFTSEDLRSKKNQKALGLCLQQSVTAGLGRIAGFKAHACAQIFVHFDPIENMYGVVENEEAFADLYETAHADDRGPFDARETRVASLEKMKVSELDLLELKYNVAVARERAQAPAEGALGGIGTASPKEEDVKLDLAVLELEEAKKVERITALEQQHAAECELIRAKSAAAIDSVLLVDGCYTQQEKALKIYASASSIAAAAMHAVCSEQLMLEMQRSHSGVDHAAMTFPEMWAYVKQLLPEQDMHYFEYLTTSTDTSSLRFDANGTISVSDFVSLCGDKHSNFVTATAAPLEAWKVLLLLKGCGKGNFWAERFWNMSYMSMNGKIVTELEMCIKQNCVRIPILSMVAQAHKVEAKDSQVKGKCNHCGKEGHWKMNCPLLVEKPFRIQYKNQGGGGGGHGAGGHAAGGAGSSKPQQPAMRFFNGKKGSPNQSSNVAICSEEHIFDKEEPGDFGGKALVAAALDDDYGKPFFLKESMSKQNFYIGGRLTIDSGTTKHIANKGMLSDLKNIKANVKYGNGSVENITQQGWLAFYVGNTRMEVQCWASHVVCNPLISARLMAESGAIITYERDCDTIDFGKLGGPKIKLAADSSLQVKFIVPETFNHDEQSLQNLAGERANQVLPINSPNGEPDGDGAPPTSICQGK